MNVDFNRQSRLARAIVEAMAEEDQLKFDLTKQADRARISRAIAKCVDGVGSLEAAQIVRQTAMNMRRQRRAELLTRDLLERVRQRATPKI